jgi:hypothetical protein
LPHTCPSMNDQWNEAPCHTHGHERPRKLGPLPHTWPSMNDQGKNACEAGKARSWQATQSGYLWEQGILPHTCPSMNDQGNEAPCHTHAHERPREQGTLPHTCPSMNDQGKNACEAGKARVMASHTVRIPMGTRHLATQHAHERPRERGTLPHTCP